MFSDERRGLHGLNFPSKKGAPRVFYHLLQMWDRREEGGVRLKRCQQSDIKKWSQTFYYMKTTYIYFLLMLLAHHSSSGSFGPWHLYSRLSEQLLSGTLPITSVNKKKKKRRTKEKIVQLTLNYIASVQKCHVSLYLYFTGQIESHVSAECKGVRRAQSIMCLEGGRTKNTWWPTLLSTTSGS